LAITIRHLAEHGVMCRATTYRTLSDESLRDKTPLHVILSGHGKTQLMEVSLPNQADLS